MKVQRKPHRNEVRILLVDDDGGEVKAVIRGFEKARVANEILRAVDGVEALDILKGRNGRKAPTTPFIVLVDLNMPRMGGLELIARIRRDPELRRTVIFALTTSDRDQDKVRAYDLNVAGFLLKQKAGEDFVALVGMLDSFWRIVELPE